MADTRPAQRYRRVLLKLSGEALLGSRQYGVDPGVVVVVGQLALTFLAEDGRDLLPPDVPVISVLVPKPDVQWRGSAPPL